jgi:inner membrane protein
MIARAGLGKGVPRGSMLLMIAANAPDLDIVSWFAGTVAYLHYHRWFTHALLAMPLMAVVSVLIVRPFVKGPFPWGRAVLVGCAGVLSHVLLDWTNTYGIRLLMPFSSEWLRLDITNIVDLWIWLVLLLALVAPALARLVSSEIGAKSGTGRGWAIFALVFLMFYEYGRYVLHNRAVAVMNARLYDGAPPVRVAALPGFANPLQWRGIVETGDAYRLLDVNLNRTFDPAAGRVIYKSVPPEAALLKETRPFQVFLDFSAFPQWRVLPIADREGATQVEVHDLRFGDPQNPRFVATGVVNAAKQVESAEFGFGPVQPK